MKNIKVKNSKEFILQYIYGVHGQNVVVNEGGDTYRADINIVVDKNDYRISLNHFNEFTPLQIYRNLEENGFVITTFDNDEEIEVEAERLNFKDLFDNNKEFYEAIAIDLVEMINEEISVEEDEEEHFEYFKDELLNVSSKQDVEQIIMKYAKLDCRYELDSIIQDFFMFIP